MGTLTLIELSVSGLGKVIATAWVSDDTYPHYFTTGNINKIKETMEAKRIKVPKKVNVTTTGEYDRMVGPKSMRLISREEVPLV